jgi:gluconokinase
MNIEGLRSPYVKTGGIVYFARMIDKIRLHAEGKLPGDYVPNLGKGFDGRCCSFLGIDYVVFKKHVLEGGTDEELLAWAVKHGRQPDEEQIEVWNGFMTKRGWNDDSTPILQKRLADAGLQDRKDILTMFAFLDADEGRSPASA